MNDEICRLVGCGLVERKARTCIPATCGVINERCEVCGEPIINHEVICKPFEEEH